MHRVSGIDGRLATWPEYPVREVERIRALQAERVSPDLGCKRQTAADLINPANLPTANEPAHATLVPGRRNLPDCVEHSIVKDIEVGQRTVQPRIEPR